MLTSTLRRASKCTSALHYTSPPSISPPSISPPSISPPSISPPSTRPGFTPPPSSFVNTSKFISATAVTDITPFLSSTSLCRRPSVIRELQKLITSPNVISLGGGDPDGSLFPISGITVELQNGEEIKLTNISDALQYSPSLGLPRLLELLHDLQETYHKSVSHIPPKIMVCTGAQDAITMAYEMLLGPGDTLLVEEATYCGVLSFLIPMGIHLVPLACDSEGIVVSDFQHKVEEALSHQKRPPVLYTVPTGCNPAGICTSFDRKQQIYQLSQQHNMVILEDDPYYHLHFMDDYTPSYLSLDTDGRVLRFDSFSKLISAGLRVGYVTGHPSFIRQLELHAQSTYLHPSGASQALLLAILEHWRASDNIKKHISMVQQVYRRRRDTCIHYIEKHLKGKLEYEVPKAGMFIWASVVGVSDTSELVEYAVEEQKVLLVPGSAFSPTETASKHIRISFSTATEANMEEGLLRLSKAIDMYRVTT